MLNNIDKIKKIKRCRLNQVEQYIINIISNTICINDQKKYYLFYYIVGNKIVLEYNNLHSFLYYNNVVFYKIIENDNTLRDMVYNIRVSVFDNTKNIYGVIEYYIQKYFELYTKNKINYVDYYRSVNARWDEIECNLVTNNYKKVLYIK